MAISNDLGKIERDCRAPKEAPIDNGANAIASILTLNKKFLKIVLIFVVSALICGSLQAIMIKLPLSQLTLESETIVLADVLQVKCEWSWDRRIILSIVSLQVEEVLKGKLDQPEILIQVPGGKVGDIGLRVSDMPDFAAGEKVLVFLSEIPDRIGNRNSPSLSLLSTLAFQVFGAAQGKYRIEGDGRAWKNGYELLKEGGEEDRSLALSDLKGIIRNVLERSRRLRGK